MIVGGTLYWLNARHFETTDDAFVDAYTTQIAPRVAGQVTKLLFADNQHVAAGQTLLLIDPRDYQAKLDQAKAQQASAEASLAAGPGAGLRAAGQRRPGHRQCARRRSRPAAGQAGLRPVPERSTAGAVTRQQVDAATATFHSAQAKLDASRQTVERRAGPGARRAGAGAGGPGFGEAGRGDDAGGGTAAFVLHDRGAGRGHRDASHRRAPATTSMPGRRCSPWCRTTAG